MLPENSYEKSVFLWLVSGVILVFFQVVLGGITRLTGSGLSITEWNVIMGALPPLNPQQWNEAFELYKATPQFELINPNMDLSGFKFIFFWEFVHRLWARMMGLIFLFPFLWFLIKGKLSTRLVKKLGIVILMAVWVASVGWLMVRSGLVDRPWVSPFRLSIHLTSAVVLFGYLWWVMLSESKLSKGKKPKKSLLNLSIGFSILILLQIVFGGLMAGMKAGLVYPTFPLMNGELLPSELLVPANWSMDAWANYDTTIFARTFVQFIHRLLAVLIVIVSGILWFKKSVLPTVMKRTINLLNLTVLAQFILGVLTVINCKGEIPLVLGVLHQACALILWAVALTLNFQTKKSC